MTKAIVGKELLDQLAAPFAPEDIEWRVQSATNVQGYIKLLVLPYIQSRAVMNRFDEVCGANWQSHYDKIVVNGVEAFQCRLAVKIGDEWITRTDAAEVSDIESVKGGHSNALKRAAVQWGVGRYLYDCPQYWVDLKQQGEHRVYGDFRINGKKQRISGYFDTPTLPDWALPQGTIQSKPQTKPQQKQQPKPQQKQQQTKQQQKGQVKPNVERRRNAVVNIKRLLQTLKIPLKYVPRIMNKAAKIEGNWEDATLQQLISVYKILEPPAQYVEEARMLGLSTRQILDYAQITLKMKIDHEMQLLFMMDKDVVEKTLDLIKADQQIAS